MFIIKQKQQIERVSVFIPSIKTLQGVQTAVKKWPKKYEILVIQTLLLINKKFLYCVGLFSDHCMTYKVAGPSLLLCERSRVSKINTVFFSQTTSIIPVSIGKFCTVLSNGFSTEKNPES